MFYSKPERILLKSHLEYNEKWVQDKIAEDPAILGLGELELLARERIQPRAGRLDLLLRDDDNKRYEVELQLGGLDESHIIRAVEYWDVERKRYPQYDHCAVIVAEDITSRFLNVVSIFNGAIPLVAIQMQMLKVDKHEILVFTTIMNEFTRGDDDEGTAAAPTDRTYWEQKGTKGTVAMADQALELLTRILDTTDPTLELNYTKFYIGLVRNGQSDNFVIFKPQKIHMMLELRLKQSEEIGAKIDDAGLDTLEYHRGAYRIRLRKGDIKKHEEVLQELMGMAFDYRNR